MQSQELPIGFWIKQVDELFTKGTNEIQSSFGLTRTEWQVLNSIKAQGKANEFDLLAHLKPFVDRNALAVILAAFRIKKIVDDKDEKFILTDEGNELHDMCFEKQKVFRQKAVQNISEQQYQQTILTLKKIVENLA